MPSSASTTSRSENLISRLSSAVDDGDSKLKALRDLKNQIIGNRTKKLAYIKLGAVPSVVSILSQAEADSSSSSFSSSSSPSSSLLVQSAAVLGSFACGVDAGVTAILDAGAFSHLSRLLSNSDDKVVDAGARALRMIFQSKLAPKYDFLQEENVKFLLKLLNSENENVAELGASIITHSCVTRLEQKALYDAGVLKKLISLLEGSLSLRDASLESLATIFKNNSEVISQFVGADGGKALNSLIKLMKDRYPRTRLLSCICLTVIRNSSPCYVKDLQIKIDLVLVLLELLDDPRQVGDEAPFALASLTSEKEDMQKLAFEADAIVKLSNHLQNGPVQSKRLQGILLALADLCSKLESCRSRFLSLQVLNWVTSMLTNDSADVRVAACICIKCVSRSIKSLSAGLFMNEMIVIPLIELLHDSCVSVQVAALGAISNLVVDFTMRKLAFISCGGLKQLVHLSKSMDSSLRLNAVWALRNLVFLADIRRKEEILIELTSSTLVNLINDPEPFVQEQALAFTRNLVDGNINSIEHVLNEDCAILNAAVRQLWSASKTEVLIQGMYLLTNVASGNELHKEAVMLQLHREAGDCSQTVVKFLQSNDSRLRIATVWAVINLTYPNSPGAFGRVVKLRSTGVYSQLRNMVNDSCLDVKLHVRTALGHFMTFGDGCT